MRFRRGNTIVLKPGRQKKIGMGCIFGIFVALAVFMCLMMPQNKGGILLMIGFTLMIIMGGAAIESSSGARITLTKRFLSGGTFRRKTIAWENLGDVWEGDETIEWESKDAKPITCQTPWHEIGRECTHNGRHVSLRLAIDWIEALRDAKSENERDALLREFRGAAPKTFTPFNQLSTRDRAKADELLRELKNFRGAGRARRVAEITQLFRDKGWEPPKGKLLMNLLTPRTVIGCALFIAACFIIAGILLGKLN